MEFIAQLWLPILLSAVFVFIVSSIIHMALPVHKNDFKKLKGEDAVLATIRAQGVEPGSYVFPHLGCSMKEMSQPESVEKRKTGPVGYMTVLPPGGLNMGASLIAWFVYSLIIGLLVAYVGWHSLGPGAEYLTVFRITGAAAVLGYAAGALQDSIWKGVRWSTTAKFTIDGIVYGLVTAGTFGWLWPAAVGAAGA